MYILEKYIYSYLDVVGLSGALMRTENTHRDWEATGSGDD